MDSSLSGRSILVVEDEFLVAFHWETVLEEQGASVRTAATIEEAMMQSKDGIDAAVLDISLLDGEVYPVADELHKRGIPFVFHSGHGNLEELADRYPGAEAIVKPASEAVLVRTLERVVALATA